MRPTVGSGDGVNLVDHDEPQVAEELRRRQARRPQHHVQGLRRRQQERGGLAHEGPLRAVGDVPVPHEAARADHLGVRAEGVFLVVEQRLDGRDVQHDAVRRALDQPRERRKHRRLGLASGRRREHHGVLAVENRLPPPQALAPGAGRSSPGARRSPPAATPLAFGPMLWEPVITTGCLLKGVDHDKAPSRKLLPTLAGVDTTGTGRFGSWSGSVPTRVPLWFAFYGRRCQDTLRPAARLMRIGIGRPSSVSARGSR